MNQHIKDDGDLRRYYSQIPHLADDEMDAYEMRLYVHYKRVCGRDGDCHETTETTATKCQMSERKVQQTRRTLAENGWIKVEFKGARGHTRAYVTLIDRWNDNYKHFNNETTSTPAPDAPVHIMHPLPPHDMHLTPAPDAPKRRTNKEKERKNAAHDTPPPSDHQAIVQAYVEELGYNPPNGAVMGKAAKWLVQHGYTPEQVRGCYRYLKSQKFYQDKMLGLQVVQRELPEYVKRTTAPPSPVPVGGMVERGGEMIRRVG